MKKIASITAALIVGALVWTPAQAVTVLTASSWVPPKHPLTTDILMGWTDAVEKATNGRVKFNILPKAPVAPPGTFDAVKDGIVDASFTVHGYTPGRFVLTKMTEFGFLGDSAESISVAYQRMYEKHLAKFDEHKGVKVIAVFSHGPGHMYTTKTPLNSVADLEGKKIRVGGGVVNDVAKAIGASPLLKPAPQSFEILNSGVADGIFFPAESIQGFKLTGVIRNASLVPGGLYNTSFAMMMNQAKFNALPKEDQDAINKVSGEYFAHLAGKGWDKADAAGVVAMKAAGIDVKTTSPEFVAALKAKTAPIEASWYNEIKGKGLDGAALMKEFRAEIAKVAAGK
ncbi:MAG: TRAP transporter substrate-binding protein [Sulfuritalea sp.]|nr:TRAP transporter substrate-binding protein [Sulfuritalea sp.]